MAKRSPAPSALQDGDDVRRPLWLGYCANVHPGETLADVLVVADKFAAGVRRELGRDRLGLGLWLSRSALSEIQNAGTAVLRTALERNQLDCFTLNGFPYGNFQASVVKRAVYHPDLATDERRRYLLELATVLTELLPTSVDEGTISTLPIAHRDEADATVFERALVQLCTLAEELARLSDRTGRRIRVCLEPEPGCFLETTAQAIALFTEDLPEAVRRAGRSLEAIRQHLGVCFDCCHQAVAFEDVAESLDALCAADVTVGKIQLSSALVVGQPSRSAEQLFAFDEPRFLHQLRARRDDGELIRADDLGEAAALAKRGTLPLDRQWRVHFHVPIHREVVGEIGTTREAVVEALACVRSFTRIPHLEVETYTWSVLPESERPSDDASLMSGIAAELAWVEKQLGELAECA